MSPVHRFDAVRRARFLAYVECGRSIREAAARVGVTETTVGRWRRRGRAHPESEAGAFETALVEALAGGDDLAGPLSEADVRRALEAQVRRGNVAAMRVLLAHFPAGDPPVPAEDGAGWIDELAARRAPGRRT